MSNLQDPKEGETQPTAQDDSKQAIDLNDKKIASLIDQEVNKRVGKFKKQELQGEVQGALRGLFSQLFPDMQPDDNEDPVRALSETVNGILERERQATAINTAHRLADEYGLDQKTAEKFMGQTEEETREKFEYISSILKERDKTAVESFTKQNSRTVANPNPTNLSEIDALNQQLNQAYQTGNAAQIAAVQRRLYEAQNQK